MVWDISGGGCYDLVRNKSETMGSSAASAVFGSTFLTSVGDIREQGCERLPFVV